MGVCFPGFSPATTNNTAHALEQQSNNQQPPWPLLRTMLLFFFFFLLLTIGAPSSSLVVEALSLSTKRIPYINQGEHPIGSPMWNKSMMADVINDVRITSLTTTIDRRTSLGGMLTMIALASSTLCSPAYALVEGSKPPRALSEEYRQGTAALGDGVEAEVLPRDAYKKLPSGVIYADISLGSNGEIVREGSKVNIQWVLRRSNGYFVDSSAVSDSVPFIFTVGDPVGAIHGLDEGIRGMKVGGSRRILIPPALAYIVGLMKVSLGRYLQDLDQNNK